MSKSIVMKAASSDDSFVPLDVYSDGMAQYFQVHFGILYTGACISAERLASAFATILPSFKVLAGRLVKQKGGLGIFCNNAGVPLSTEVRTGKAPSFQQLLPEDVFDLVRDEKPLDEGPAAEALMRVRLLDYDDGQVLAVSLNHGLCDAVGIGEFMKAWAEAYCGGSGPWDVSHDRVQSYPKTPGLTEASISHAEGVPEAWLEVRHVPEAVPDVFFEVAEPVHVCYERSAEECVSLKERCVAAAAEPDAKISTNDALTMELVTSLGIDAERVPVSIIKEFRSLIGARTVFSNLWVGIELLPRNSLAGAVDIRKTLPHADSREFIEWHIGQGHCGMNTAWKSKLFMNTWAKAFSLDALAFEGAASEVMLGRPMMQMRAALMAPAGMCYCIVLPAANGGIKVVAVLPRAAAERLKANGLVVSMLASDS